MSSKRVVLRFFTLTFVALLWTAGDMGSSLAQADETPEIVIEIKWHPRGEGLFVIGRGSPGVWGLWLFDTNLQLVRFFQTESQISADWSPDGTRLAMGRDIRDVQTLDVLLTLSSRSGIGGWSPDGAQVLAWVDERNLGLYDSNTGALVRSVPTGEMIPDAVLWSPDGEYFALLQPIGRTDIISAQDGRLITTVPMEYPIGLRWSPDSRYLAAAFLTDAEPGTPNTLPYAPSPKIAFVTVWETLSGGTVHTFSGLPAVPLRLRWNPQKPELAGAAGEGVLYIWNLETGQQMEIYRPILALISMDYSPYGGRVIVGSWKSRQVIYETQPFAMANSVRWSQDIVADVVRVVIPDPSLELLESVESACVPITVADVLPAARESAQDLNRYAELVRENTEIGPGCRADLLAVAEALMAEAGQ
ncbi:MAG: WD40 repeat domain-containing protein [Chloroflexi bacterium]|nr:WD40 repeat domain-containing protein [Chloroflexota bacterium]